MTPDEAEFAAYLAHPDTNRMAFEALVDEAMAPIDFAATMKVQHAVWREVDERS